MMTRRTLLLTAGLVVVTLAGCSPSLSPLYRDFTFEEAEAEVLGEEKAVRITAALAEAGWQLASSELPDVIATEPKTFDNWGLYKTSLALEVLSVGGDYVRVYFHPYRIYFTGGRSKLPYLSRGLQNDVLPALVEAFEAQGLALVGRQREREPLASGQ
jgi:hypothetical protein